MEVWSLLKNVRNEKLSNCVPRDILSLVLLDNLGCIVNRDIFLFYIFFQFFLFFLLLSSFWIKRWRVHFNRIVSFWTARQWYWTFNITLLNLVKLLLPIVFFLLLLSLYFLFTLLFQLLDKLIFINGFTLRINLFVFIVFRILWLLDVSFARISLHDHSLVLSLSEPANKRPPTEGILLLSNRCLYHGSFISFVSHGHSQRRIYFVSKTHIFILDKHGCYWTSLWMPRHSASCHGSIGHACKPCLGLLQDLGQWAAPWAETCTHREVVSFLLNCICSIAISKKEWVLALFVFSK